MKAILDIFPILAVYPYALLYYLILIAASGLAFLAVRRSASRLAPSRSSSLPIALLVIFFSQLILLSLSLLAYQGFTLVEQLSPLAHRALTLITLIWLVWALLDIHPQGWQRFLPLGFTLLAFALGCLAAPAWSPQSESSPFNGSRMDQAWIIATLLLLLVGLVLYLREKRAHKLEGTLVLLIAALGILVYLLFPNNGSLPGAVMLSQMLYYPLLISIAWQTSAHSLVEGSPETLEDDQNLSSRPGISPQVAASLLDVGLQTELPQIQNALTHSIGLFLLADLCGIVEKDPSKPGLRVTSMYDLIREEYLSPFFLPYQEVPTFQSHFEDSLPLMGNDPSELKEEKRSLLEAIGYNQSGSIFLYPLNPSKGITQFALLCLSPYTNRSWTQEDQDRLAVVASKLEQILQNAAAIDERTRTSDKLRISLNQLEREKFHLQEQLEHNQALMNELHQEYIQNKNAYAAEIQMWVERQKVIEAQIDSLSETIKSNQATIAQAEELKQQKNALEETLARNSQHISNLREALENARNVINQLILMPEPGQVSAKASPEALLLSEDHSRQPTAPSQDPAEKAAALALRTTMEEVAISFMSREIQLHSSIDPLPEVSPDLVSLLQEVLELLEVNAFSASPNQGEVNIAIGAGVSQNDQPTIEMQVTDQGGGLSEQEQTQFVRMLTRSGFPVPSGIGDAVALRKAIKLVQRAKGHWWIHSQINQPTTYLVSIPHKYTSTGSGEM
ncbi:MAG: hypothetical protein WA110_07970 [Anaerolineaceae bacterium]